MMENIFIRDCFKNLKNNTEIFKLNYEELEGKYHIPKEIIDKQPIDKTNNTWKLVATSITSNEIKKIEERFCIKFPNLYKEFIGTFAHLITKLNGTVDNFLFEDNVEVTWELSIQPFTRELEYIIKSIENTPELIKANYLYIGEFNSSGPLCIDLIASNEDEMRIVCFDYEDWCRSTTREDFKEVEIVLFSNFKELMECFFLGKKVTCMD